MSTLVKSIPITDAMLVSSNVTEADETEWDGTGTPTSGDLQMVTTTANGAATATHKIYEFQSGGNVADDPTINDGTSWVEVGSTVRWMMFDDVLQDQTEFADEIDVDLDIGKSFNTAVLFELEGDSAQLILDDPTDGEVFNETQSLNDNSAVLTIYDYFFSPIIRKKNTAFENIPVYPNATLTLKVTNTGDTARLGKALVGMAANLGDTQKGSSYGILDYSVKNTVTDPDDPDYGRVTYTQGSYSETAKLIIKTEEGNEAGVSAVLVDARTLPAAWIGNFALEGTFIFGISREYEITYGSGFSIINLEVEGLQR